MLPPAAGGPWAGKAALESRGWKQHLPKHTGTPWAPLQAASRRLQPSVPALPRRHGLPRRCPGSQELAAGQGHSALLPSRAASQLATWMLLSS